MGFGVSRQQPGQALLTAVIFLLFASVGLLLSFSSIALRETRSSRIDVRAKQSYFLAEAGVEDVVWRIRNGKQYAASQTVTIDGSATTVTVADAINKKIVESTGEVASAVRKTRTTLRTGTGVAFRYGVQVGAAGVELGNNASVVGDLYSNGDVRGGGRGVSTITGTAQVAGTHSLRGMTVQQNAYAYQFADCAVGNTAYYVATIANCTAAATAVLAQPLPPETFPITPEQIESWKADAAAGGTLSGYTLDNNASATLGPKKIIGNISLGNNATLTLSGTVWVTGTIDFGNSDTITLAPGYGSESGVLVVDGAVGIGNTVTLSGSGQTGSYLLLVSLFGPTDAIDIGNSATGAIFYAPNGIIDIGNSLNLREATGYGLRVGNNAAITYETGLANVNFSSGPTGGWSIRNWNEVK